MENTVYWIAIVCKCTKVKIDGNLFCFPGAAYKAVLFAVKQSLKKGLISRIVSWEVDSVLKLSVRNVINIH